MCRAIRPSTYYSHMVKARENPASVYSKILNPRPRSPEFPCGLCHKAVTWRQCGVARDTCNTWHHTTCMHMSSTTYESLHNISWHCTSCRIPQFSSSFSNFTTSININNAFSSLDTSTSPVVNNRPASPPPIVTATTVALLLLSVQRHAHIPFKIMNIKLSISNE